MTDLTRTNTQSLSRPSNDVQRSTVSAITRTVDAAEGLADSILSRRPGLLARWSKVGRERQNAEVKLVRTELDAYHRTLLIMRESAIQTLQESVNTMLIMGKGNARNERNQHLMQKQRELQVSIDTAHEQLAEDIDREFEKIQTYKYPRTRQAGMERLDDKLDKFKTFTDRLMADFSCIIDEQIRPEPAR